MKSIDELIEQNPENLIDRNIALVMPSYGYAELSNSHGKRESSSITPPLGLLSIAAHIKKHKLAENVKIFDSSTFESEDSLIRNLGEYLHSGDILGATTYTRTYPMVQKLVNNERFDDMIKIAGGPLATAIPKKMLDDFHFVFRGESEDALTDFLKGYPNFIGTKIKGVAYQHNENIIDGGRRFVDIENLSLPLYSELDFNNYKSASWRDLGSKSASYMTSYSCSGGKSGPCTFCSTAYIHGKFREKSTRKVLFELNELVDNLEFKCIDFWDDNFLERKDAPQIMQFLKKKDVLWTAFARADSFVSPDLNIKEGVMKSLAESGCKRIFYGIESANDDIRNVVYKKNVSKNQIEKAIKLSNKYGIKTKAGFIIGAPTETTETIQESIDFMCQLPLNYVDVSVLSPDHGTALYRKVFRKTIIMPDYSRPDALFEPLGMPTMCNNFSKKELSNFVTQAYKSFYGREEWYVNQLGKVDSSRERDLIDNLYKNALSKKI